MASAEHHQAAENHEQHDGGYPAERDAADSRNRCREKRKTGAASDREYTSNDGADRQPIRGRLLVHDATR